jgi:hypothetical protein
MKNTVPDIFIFSRDTLTGFQKVAYQGFFRDSLERPALPKSTPKPATLLEKTSNLTNQSAISQ